jgi:hypothetical protein
MMIERKTKSILLVAALASALGALWACDTTQTAALQQQPTPPVGNENIAHGQPWAGANDYLTRLEFPPRPETFPHKDVQLVQLCDVCQHVLLRVVPEMRMRFLKRADVLPNQRRIVARIDWLPTVNLPLIGAIPENQDRRAYVLAKADGTAELIYRVNSEIRVAPLKLKFSVTGDGNIVNFPMARWKQPDPHNGGPIDHLSGIWVACAEGCCTATAH